MAEQDGLKSAETCTHGGKIRAKLQLELHLNYFNTLLNGMPHPFKTLQTNRLMVLYFCVNALDVLNGLHKISEKRKQEIIDFIYSNQVTKRTKTDDGEVVEYSGFIGGGFTGPAELETKYHEGHITMTYSALLTLAILGDDFSRVNKGGIIANLGRLQNDDGSFQAVGFGSETDARFLFCAVAISFMLQDWSGINVDSSLQFALAVQSHDGGIGLLPGQESHGGPSYCICATLALLGRLEDYPGRNYLERFLVSRQIGGFNGRINKKPDTCYTFWVGGALQILGMEDYIDSDTTREFVLSCQSNKLGGFSKVPGVYPDPLHSHFSVCGLSLIREPGLLPIESSIGMTVKSFQSSPFAKGKCANGAPFVPRTCPL